MWNVPALADTDVVARAAVVEGYNTNTYQAQDDPTSPVVRRHPSPFTGVDANLELRFLGRDTDRTILIVDARGNHYEPLQNEYQSDDGGLNAMLASRITLGPRTALSLSDSAAVTSFNGSHVTDGTIFAFDPTQVRSSYWIDGLDVDLTHQLSKRWKLGQSIGVMLSGTIQSSPTRLPGGTLVEHRGVDYVMPYVETDLSHDFTPRSSGDVMLLYQYAWQLFVLDFTQSPPRDIGPDKLAFLTLLAGWSRHWTPELTTVLRAGGVLASAPPRDPDQRAVLAPAAMAELYYTRPFFDVVAAGSYTWGTVNPRLGAGPTASASLLAIGIPRPRGAWKELALIARGQAAYSTLVTGVDQSVHLALVAVGCEARYGLNRWLGLLGGYDLRYATFDTPGQFSPPFLQQVFFIGLGGYFSNDRTVLPLTTFTAPVQPPT
jgi:hypothetical protein